MNKKYRTGTEISISFSSGLNYLRSKDIKLSLKESNAHPPDLELSLLPKPQFASFKLNIKTMLRPFVRLVYGFVKLLLKPIAFRARRYFAAEPNQQMLLQIIQNVAMLTMQEAREAKESLSEEIQRITLAVFHKEQQTSIAFAY